MNDKEKEDEILDPQDDPEMEGHIEGSSENLADENNTWTGEFSDDEENSPVNEESEETLAKGTPSWATIPDEKVGETLEVNPDLEDMSEIHELDELDRLDELEEIDNQDDTDVDEEMEVNVTPIVSIGTLNEPISTLLNQEEVEEFRTRWSKIQGNFVDEPKTAVQEAEILVSDVIEEMKRKFADELSALDSQWNNGSKNSTEDLRLMLQLYRSFFHRLIGKV